MKKKDLIRIRKTSAALTMALALLAGGVAVCADEITMDDGSAGFDDSSSGGGSLDLDDSGFLIEDTGQDVQYNAGVPMDTLQDAMDSGNEKLLDKIASLGALTGSPTASGSGVGGGGAYRGDDDEDDEDYYDLQLDEGDADEVQTEKNKESPGPLLAANPERVQEHLDQMMQVDSPTGSDGELTVAAYIETKMGELGYTVQEQAFHEGVLNEEGVDAPGVNILAERGANSQTNRKKDIFLVVTHYDSKRSPAEDDPFANDKSGAAALIETARILAEVVTDTDICFLFLSGEEDGGYGAQNFINSLSEENRSRITGVLSVERVGYDSDTPYVLKTLTGEGNPLGDIVQQLGILNDAQLSLREDSAASDEEDVGTWVGVGESSDGYIDEKTAEQIAQAQAGQDLENAGTIEMDDAENFVEDDGAPVEEMELDEEETEGEPIPMPSAWSYLKDSSPGLSSFANASLPTVMVSQYMPDLDGASYEETKALGLADTTLETVNQVMAEVASATAETSPDSQDASSAGVVQLQDSNLTGSADETVALEEASSLEDTGEGGENAELPGMEEAAKEYDDLPTVDAALVADTTNVIAAALAQIMDPAT